MKKKQIVYHYYAERFIGSLKRTYDGVLIMEMPATNKDFYSTIKHLIATTDDETFNPKTLTIKNLTKLS